MQIDLRCPETRQVYSPANICIYCGATEDEMPLRTEHIFPAGLGGKLELPKSSCDSCGAKTGSFEQKLLRGPLWPIRVRTGIHSGRRPGEQPRDFDMEFWRGEERELHSVPIDKMSVNLVLPDTKPPGILCGGDWDEVYERTHTLVISFDEGGFDRGLIGTRFRREGTSGVTVGGTVDMLLFRRLIAKIAHGYARAELGSSFRPCLIPLILGSDVRDAGQLVGGSARVKDMTMRHGVGLCIHSVGDQQLVIAAVSIFMPVIGIVFLAVVGHAIADALE
jgi:hypothetical protein